MSALPMLVVTKEGETLKSLAIEGEISVGRAEGNVIRLEDRAVSRQHALIRKTPEGIQVEKQSDFAPIKLNGTECTRAFLKEGDVVEIGPYRMRLTEKKAEKREEKKAPLLSTPAPVVEDVAPAAPVEPIFSSATEATIALPDEAVQKAEALPTESSNLLTTEMPSENVIGDFTTQLEGGDAPVALPIEADAAGAEKGSADPGTNIFEAPADGAAAAEEPAPADALNINFDLSADAAAPADAGPVDVTSIFDENAATKVIKAGIDARLDIPDGLANVMSFDLDKDEVFIGRGKECDIVLNDKKSSRKNTSISKVGNRYVIRDLESSNGTYVNGQAVQEKELSADDRIRIGEVEIHFVALNPDYERKKDSFLAVDPGPSVAPFASQAPAQATIDPAALGALPYPPGSAPMEGGVPQPAKARGGLGGIYDKYIKNFKTLAPVQKLLVVLCVGLFLSWYFEDELGLSEPEKAPQKQVVKKTDDGKSVVVSDYDHLSPEKKAQIDEAIRRATDFLRQMDYDKAIYEVQQKVYPILPEYAQAKEIERYANEGKRRKEAIAEEARKKEEEEKLKARIVELETQTRTLMNQKKYDEAKETFADILAIDPDNAAVSDWKKQIEAWMEEQARIEQERQVQEEINKRSWDQYNEAFELHKAGKYREAIANYKKIPELGTNDESLLKKVATMIKTCQDSIRDLREPHLKRAKEMEAAGDLAGAFKEYQAATEIDPPHPDGWAGMDRIRDVLNERAKVLYVEAVIAESYSDFKTAHAKFDQIMKMAPEGSLYYQRAQRKLQSYLNFKSTDEELPPQ